MRERRWVLPGATLCAGVVAAALFLALRPAHHPVATAPSKASSARSTGSPTSEPVAAARPIGLWGGTQLGSTRIEAWTLTAIGGRLYATVRTGVRKQFVRLDPRTGAVLARSAPNLQETYGPPIGAAGLIWFQGDSSAQLLGLDPLTLQRRAGVTVSLPGASGGFPAVLAAGPDRDTLLVGGQRRVAFIDATRSRVERHLNVPGLVTGVAISPDGSRLYVASTPALSDERRRLRRAAVDQRRRHVAGRLPVGRLRRPAHRRGPRPDKGHSARLPRLDHGHARHGVRPVRQP